MNQHEVDMDMDDADNDDDIVTNNRPNFPAVNAAKLNVSYLSGYSFEWLT